MGDVSNDRYMKNQNDPKEANLRHSPARLKTSPRSVVLNCKAIFSDYEPSRAFTIELVRRPPFFDFERTREESVSSQLSGDVLAKCK